MARKVHSRYIISGILVAQSPLHIGGVHNDSIVDLTLAVNGADHYYIPGTSLTGALRAWMEEMDISNTDGLTGDLWGPRLGNNGGANDDKGHASWVIIEDAVIQGNVQAELRDGVGIDRLYGSAAECIKFDRAILPKGTQIDLHLIVERDIKHSDSTWEPIRQLWTELLQALLKGELSLGAAKTRGLGAVKLENLDVQEQILHSRAGILKVLNGDSSSSSAFPVNTTSPNPIARSTLTITVNWKPISPLMVKAEREGIAVNMLPLVSGIDGEIGDRIAFVLPGSSIKGTLRSQAERIVRTICDMELPKQANSKQAFLQQLEIPLINELFGKAAKSDNKQQSGRMGTLAVDDCYANHTLSVDLWEKVQIAKESKELVTALENAGLHQTQQAFHVAVDRWTGGAAESFLYSTLEPMNVSWEPISLKLNLRQLQDSDQQKQCLALLLLVLRDLSEGRIPLGYGVNRGMGAISVNSITVNGLKSLNPDLKDPVTLAQGQLTNLDPAFLANLDRAWQSWISSRQTGEDNDRS